MKPQFPESAIENQRQTFRHVALSFESSEGIKPQVGTLQNSHDGFAHVDHSRQATVGLAPDQRANRTSRAKTLDVGFVLLMGPRRKNPRPMQALASPCGFENLAFAIRTGLRQKDPTIRVRVGEDIWRVLFSHSPTGAAEESSNAVMRDVTDWRLGYDADSLFVGRC